MPTDPGGYRHARHSAAPRAAFRWASRRQLLVSIVGFGRLFELYSSRFLMEHFWALLFVLFAFAFALNEGLVWLERRVEYYAASRE